LKKEEKKAQKSEPKLEKVIAAEKKRGGKIGRIRREKRERREKNRIRSGTLLVSKRSERRNYFSRACRYKETKARAQRKRQGTQRKGKTNSCKRKSSP